jgi:hypothetical protein
MSIYHPETFASEDLRRLYYGMLAGPEDYTARLIMLDKASEEGVMSDQEETFIRTSIQLAQGATDKDIDQANHAAFAHGNREETPLHEIHLTLPSNLTLLPPLVYNDSKIFDYSTYHNTTRHEPSQSRGYCRGGFVEAFGVGVQWTVRDRMIDLFRRHPIRVMVTDQRPNQHGRRRFSWTTEVGRVMLAIMRIIYDEHRFQPDRSGPAFVEFPREEKALEAYSTAMTIRFRFLAGLPPLPQFRQATDHGYPLEMVEEEASLMIRNARPLDGNITRVEVDRVSEQLVNEHQSIRRYPDQMWSDLQYYERLHNRIRKYDFCRSKPPIVKPDGEFKDPPPQPSFRESTDRIRQEMIEKIIKKHARDAGFLPKTN